MWPISELGYATTVARISTFSLVCLCFLSLFAIPVEQLSWTQKTAIEQRQKQLQISGEASHLTQTQWVLLTASKGSWLLTVPETELKESKQQKVLPTKEKTQKGMDKVVDSSNLAVKKESFGSSSHTKSTNGSSGKRSQDTIIFRELVKVIERNKHYPKRARAYGIQGVIKVVVSIDSHGVVKNYHLENGGHALLRMATQEASAKLIGLQTSASSASQLTIPVYYQIH